MTFSQCVCCVFMLFNHRKYFIQKHLEQSDCTTIVVVDNVHVYNVCPLCNWPTTENYVRTVKVCACVICQQSHQHYFVPTRTLIPRFALLESSLHKACERGLCIQDGDYRLCWLHKLICNSVNSLMISQYHLL